MTELPIVRYESALRSVKVCDEYTPGFSTHLETLAKSGGYPNLDTFIALTMATADAGKESPLRASYQVFDHVLQAWLKYQGWGEEKDITFEKKHVVSHQVSVETSTLCRYASTIAEAMMHRKQVLDFLAEHRTWGTIKTKIHIVDERAWVYKDFPFAYNETAIGEMLSALEEFERAPREGFRLDDSIFSARDVRNVRIVQSKWHYDDEWQLDFEMEHTDICAPADSPDKYSWVAASMPIKKAVLRPLIGTIKKEQARVAMTLARWNAITDLMIKVFSQPVNIAGEDL